MARTTKGLIFGFNSLSHSVEKFALSALAFLFAFTGILIFFSSRIPPFGRDYFLQIFLLGVLLIAYGKGWRPLWLQASKKREWGGVVLLIVLYFGLLLIFNQLSGWFEPKVSEISTFRFSDYQIHFQILIRSILISPILEELFFRDLVFCALAQSLGKITYAILLGSFLFMLAHLSLYPGAFILGVVSSLLVIGSKSILPSIAFHMLSNASLYFLPIWFPAFSDLLREFRLLHFFYR